MMKTEKTNRVEQLQFWIIVMAFSSIITLFIWKVELYDKLAKEDYWVEYIGTGFLLFSGLFLISSSFHAKRFAKCILMVGGLILLIAVGEEISWAQRLFDFSTPDSLKEINQQQEFNVHNLDSGMFNGTIFRLNALLVIVCTLLVIMNQPKIFGISIPTLPVICFFTFPAFYHNLYENGFHGVDILFIPLILLLANSIKRRNKTDILLTMSTILFAATIQMVNHKYDDVLGDKNSINEYKELVLSLTICFYCYNIYQEMKRNEQTL